MTLTSGPRMSNPLLIDGLIAMRHHTQRRVDAAQKLIRDRVPLSSISHLCGFADQAHLTRAFRRTLGYTLGLYARSIR